MSVCKKLERHKEKLCSFFEPSICATFMRKFTGSWRSSGTHLYKKYFRFSFICVQFIAITVVIVYIAKRLSNFKTVASLGQLVAILIMNQTCLIGTNFRGFDQLLSIISEKFWSLSLLDPKQKKKLTENALYNVLSLSYLITSVISLGCVILTIVTRCETPFVKLELLAFSDLESPYFELAYLSLYAVIVVSFYFTLNLMLMYFTVCWNIATQFVILREFFQTTLKHIHDIESDSKTKRDAEQRLIKEFVEHHTLIVSTCNKFRKTVYISSSFIWVATVTLYVYEFVLLSMYPMETFWITIPTVIIIYLPLYWSALIYAKSSSLPDAIYCSDWCVSENIPFKKSLLIILARLQRPECLSFSGFSDMNVEVIVKLAKFSYSICAMLVFTMNKKLHV